MKIISKTVLLFISISAFSQKLELNKVTIEELEEKKCKIDTVAAAAVIFEKGKTFFEYNQNEGGFKILTDVEIKIKIYKKEGFVWANKDIPFYVGNQRDQSVLINKAVTYNLVDGKIEISKLKSEGEFVDKKNKFWHIKKINLPNVKEGSIIELRYTIKSPYISYKLPTWYFQKSIPVLYSEYRVGIPEYFKYKPYKKGSLTLNETNDKIEKNVTIIEKSRTNASFSGNVSSTNRNQYDFSYIENQSILRGVNIQALKDESFVDNINNYMSSIEYELQSIQYPNSLIENYNNDWESVVKKIYEDSDFGNQINKNGYFEEDLKTLINGVTDKSEKTAIIFNYVKSRMNWNDFRSYSCDKGVAEAYKDKIGNSAEINLMLVAMLRYAGVDASPIILSTRENGIALYPSITAFDYVIAGVELSDNVILLDATEKSSLPNLLPERALNWFGKIIRSNMSSSTIDLYPKFISKESTISMINIKEDGTLEGKIKSQKSDYKAKIFRQKNNNLNQETYIQSLENFLNGIQIFDYKVENKEKINLPIVETYSLVSSNEIEKIDDKIYINPLMFYTLNENPFKQESREYPIDFVYPNQEKYQMIYSLPVNFKIEHLPTPLNLSFSDGSLKYVFNIHTTNNQLQIISQLDFNTSRINPEDYEELKAFFNEVVKKQTEKIVLKKV